MVLPLYSLFVNTIDAVAHSKWIQPIQRGCHVQALILPNFGWLWIWGFGAVAAPLIIQDVPRNTLTWKKKIYIYILIKIFWFVYPLKKNRNTLKQYQEHSQNFYAKQILN